VDVRKLLEDKDIDAISIATPIMAFADGHLGCQAGKDVYVEKGHARTNTFEGRQLVRAVKKYNRICQQRQPIALKPGMQEATSI